MRDAHFCQPTGRQVAACSARRQKWQYKNMDILSSIISGWTDFYHSFAFSVIKFILGIYVVVVFMDIVLLLLQRSVAGDIRETLLGMNVPAEFMRKKSRDKLRIKWEKIRKEMEVGQEAQYKIGIIKADDIIMDLVRRMGYKGEDMKEVLLSIPAGQIENLEDIKKAHELKNRIIHDEKFKVSKELAEETMGTYEEFLRHHDVLD